MKCSTRISNFIPLPRFILQEDITVSAKVIYALLLARTMLSQKEENITQWSDHLGRVYVKYTIANLAKDSGISQGAVRNALEQLKEKCLIRADFHGHNQANTIYVKYPANTFIDEDSSILEFDRSNPFKLIDDRCLGTLCQTNAGQMPDICQTNVRPQNMTSQEAKKYISGQTRNDLPEMQNMAPIYTETDKLMNQTNGV